MASFFQPDIPAEDPNIARMRDQAQARADADRDRAVRDSLGADTTRRKAGTFGLESLLAGMRPGIRSLLGG
jgi:hypothetical protein